MELSSKVDRIQKFFNVLSQASQVGGKTVQKLFIGGHGRTRRGRGRLGSDIDKILPCLTIV